MNSDNRQQEQDILPAFPHTIAITKRFAWGMHLKLFAGGGTRLTARTYRAYMGYLLTVLVLFAAFCVPGLAIAWFGVMSEVLFFQFVAGVVLVAIFSGVLVFLQNGFRGLIFRLHDLGFNGWWLFLFYVVALMLDKLLAMGLGQVGIFYQFGVFSAFLGVLPFVLEGRPGRNKYGFQVQYRWYSFPRFIRVMGHVAFGLSLIFALLSMVEPFFMPNMAPYGPSLIDMLHQQR